MAPTEPEVGEVRTLDGGAPPREDTPAVAQLPAVEPQATETHKQLIDRLQTENFVMYERDCHDDHSYAGAYLPFHRYVVARDRTKKLVFVGGLGTKGYDRQWMSDTAMRFKNLPGYGNAPETPGKTILDLLDELPVD